MSRIAYTEVPRGSRSWYIVVKTRKLLTVVSRLKNDIRRHNWFNGDEPECGWAEYQQYLSFIKQDALKIVDFINELQSEVDLATTPAEGDTRL